MNVEVVNFFQLSGATLEIFVSWFKKKNSSSRQDITCKDFRRLKQIKAG